MSAHPVTPVRPVSLRTLMEGHDRAIAERDQARARERALRDALQVVVPLVDRLTVTLKQQADDLRIVREALARARALLDVRVTPKGDA